MNLFKSAYNCKCPICGFSTYHDLLFANHVKKNHSSFKIFKKYYGPCQSLVRGNGMFNCGLCDTVVKHIPTAVLGHLKKSHGLTWEAFVSQVKYKGKSAEYFSQFKDYVISASHADNQSINQSTSLLIRPSAELLSTSASSTHVSGISEERMRTLLIDMKGSASTMVLILS